jgi:hypothetical protein
MFVPKAPWSAVAPATAVRSHSSAAAPLPHSTAARVAPFLSLSGVTFPFEASVRFAQEALILLFLVLNLR